MPPELWTHIADWGFPAVLCLYLLHRADRLLTPLVTEAMALIRDISKTMEATAQKLGGLVDYVGEGTERALGDHSDIHGALVDNAAILIRIDANTLEALEMLRHIPAAKAKKEG